MFKQKDTKKKPKFVLVQISNSIIHSFSSCSFFPGKSCSRTRF